MYVIKQKTKSLCNKKQSSFFPSSPSKVRLITKNKRRHVCCDVATSGELVYQFFMQQTISDAHLFGILGALVLLDFLFLTFWTFFHPLRMIQKNVTVEVYCLFGFNRMSSVMQTSPALKKKEITKKKPQHFLWLLFLCNVGARHFNDSCYIRSLFSSALIIDLDNLIFLWKYYFHFVMSALHIKV